MSSDSDDPILLGPRHRHRRRSLTSATANATSGPSERPTKRRRLSEDALLVVESSDVGEMEELAAEDDEYWRSSPATSGPSTSAVTDNIISVSQPAPIAPLDVGPRSPSSPPLPRFGFPDLSRTPVGDRTSSILPTPSDVPLSASSALISPKHPVRSSRRSRSPSSSPLTAPPSAQSSQASIFHRLDPPILVDGPQQVIDIPPDPQPPGRVRELRPRTKKQLAPFTMDRAEYERTLRNAREAIVRDKLVARGREESQYEETQEAGKSVEAEESEDDTFMPPPSPVPRPPRTHANENEPPPKRTKRTTEDAPPAVALVDEEEIFARYGGVISDNDDPSLNLPGVTKKKHSRPEASRRPRPAPFPLPMNTHRPKPSSPHTRRRSSSTLRPSHSPALEVGNDASPSRNHDSFSLPSSPNASPAPDNGGWPTAGHHNNHENASASASRSGSNDSDNDSSQSIYLRDKDYEKMKVLSRMQPWFMVKRNLEGRTSPKTQRRPARAPSTDRTPTPEPLPPRYEDDLDTWVRYDEDDVKPPRISTRSPRVNKPTAFTVVEISDDDESSRSSDSDVEFVSATRRSPGPRMERDLIDRMLSRPTYVRKGHKPDRRPKKGHSGRTAEGHQTRIRFPVVGRTRHDDEDIPGGHDTRKRSDIHVGEAPRRRRRQHFGGSLEDDDLIFRKPTPVSRPRPADPGAAKSSVRSSVDSTTAEQSARRFQRARSSNHVILPGPLPQVSMETVPDRPPVPQASDWDLYASFSVDFGIQVLPPGIKVSPLSYIGKGRLFELLALVTSVTASDVHPRPFSGLGLVLDAEPDYPDFETK
ncbi:hypothetical protein CALCODRAFT_520353, partial [Calocera cornea HHB12733]